MGNSSNKEKNKPKNNTSPTKNKPTTSAPSSASSTPSQPASTSTSSNSSHHHHDDKRDSQASHVDSTAPNSNHHRSEESKSGFSNKKVEDLFDKYKDKDGEEQIGPEGIEQLCKDIGVDPEDVLVLVLAWHLNATRMGFFSKEEFINGLQKLGVDNISKLKGQLSNFRRDLDDQAKFKDIYRFAFGFAKERESKILDLATADALLALVLGNRYQHTEPLRQYLKEQTTYKSVNLDQWMNILEFSRSIKADLSNYDENSAWPVLLDEYCEWAKKRVGKPS